MELGDAETLVQAVAGGWARHPAPEALDALFEELPRMECVGKCSSSCGSAPVSPLEKQRITARGIDWVESAPVTLPSGKSVGVACAALDQRSLRCRVYANRPMVCRIWGLIEELACPWGCMPEGGYLDSIEGLRLVNLSMWYGGSARGIEPAKWEWLVAHPGRRRRLLEFFGQSRPVVEEPVIIQSTIQVRRTG